MAQYLTLYYNRCEVRLDKFDWAGYLGQFEPEDIIEISENVRRGCCLAVESDKVVPLDPPPSQTVMVESPRSTMSNAGVELNKEKNQETIALCSRRASGGSDSGIEKDEAENDHDTQSRLRPDISDEFGGSMANVKKLLSAVLECPTSTFLSNLGLKRVREEEQNKDPQPSRRSSKRLKSLLAAQPVVPRSSLPEGESTPSKLSHSESIKYLNTVDKELRLGEVVSNVDGDEVIATIGKQNTVIVKEGDINDSVLDCVSGVVDEKKQLTHTQPRRARKRLRSLSTDELAIPTPSIPKKKSTPSKPLTSVLVKDVDRQDEFTRESGDTNELNCCGGDVEQIILVEKEVVAKDDISMVREYVEPGLKDLKFELTGKERSGTMCEGSVVTKVTDYGSFRVTRSDSTRSTTDHGSLDKKSGSSEMPFSAYKKKMQSKLMAKLASYDTGEGEEIDIDSDSDVSTEWEPSRKEKADTISSDEGDASMTIVSLGGLMENYKCKMCSKAYQKSGHLLKHMRSCSGIEIKIEYTEQSSERQCAQCGAVFSTAGSLRRHQVNFHTNESNRQQRQSERSQVEMKVEIELKPNIKPIKEPIECRECGRTFSKSGHLLIHMNVVHMSPEKYVNPVLKDPDIKVKNMCDLCQQTFATPASLRRHIRLHDRVLIKSEQDSHTKMNNEKLYSCPTCDKSYVAKPSLKRHILTEHKGFKSKCDLCGLAVARLDNHMKLVHADTLSPCPTCAKLLAPSSLARHVRTVHMGCLTRCVECDKFVSNVHKHMAHEHEQAQLSKKEGHKDHSRCDCVFFNGPASFFKMKVVEEVEEVEDVEEAEENES